MMKERKRQERGLARVSHFFLSGPGPPRQKVSIQMAAKTLGVSRGKIINYLNKGLLTRIKEDGRVYVSMDEVKALGETESRPQVESSVSTSTKSNRSASVTKERDKSRRPMANFGLLESERQHLLNCKAALEVRDNELETLMLEVDKLKRNLDIHLRECKGTETRLKELEKEQQKRLVGFKLRTDTGADEREEIQIKLLALAAELERLRRPWWKGLFDHLRLRPEPSRRKQLLIFTTIALLAVLIFSGWWFSRTPRQTPSAVAEVQPSRSGTVPAASQAVLDSDLRSSSYPD